MERVEDIKHLPNQVPVAVSSDGWGGILAQIYLAVCLSSTGMTLYIYAMKVISACRCACELNSKGV